MLIIEILYLISAGLLSVFGLNSLILTWLSRPHRGLTDQQTERRQESSRPM